jgi:hypothetical protein
MFVRKVVSKFLNMPRSYANLVPSYFCVPTNLPFLLGNERLAEFGMKIVSVENKHRGSNKFRL